MVKQIHLRNVTSLHLDNSTFIINTPSISLFLFLYFYFLLFFTFGMTASTPNTIAFNSQTWTDGQFSTETIGPIRKDDPIVKFRCHLLLASDNIARLQAYYSLGKFLISRTAKTSPKLPDYTIRAAKRCFALFQEVGEDQIGKDPSITVKILARCSKAKLEEIKQSLLLSMLAGARGSEEDNLLPIF
jgi:hypothetical protein